MSTTSYAQWRPERPKRPSNSKVSKQNGPFASTLGVLAVLLVALVLFSSFYTEMKWYEQVEAVRVFWTQYGALIGFGALGFTLMAGVVFLNVWIAARGMDRTPASRAKARTSNDGAPAASGEGEPSASPSNGTAGSAQMPFNVENVADLFKNLGGSGKRTASIAGKKWIFFGVIPLAAGLLFGTRLALQWRSFLLWINGGSFGQSDPEYGLDVSFYVFTLPVLHEVVGFVMSMAVLSIIAVTIVYGYAGVLSIARGKLKGSAKAHRHLGILAAIFALAFAGSMWLGRYDLLLGNNSKFSGASFTDINASKPGITILAIVVACVAVLFLWAGITRRWKLGVIGVISAVVVGIVLTSVYPVLMQKFKVDPNAAELESAYIQRNIDATLAAYGLDDVDVQPYAARTTAQAGQLRQDSETAAQIRLLDPNIVAPSFNQLQQNRQYYEFVDPLVVDRYTIDGELRDTVIGVRELNLDGLSDERRSWVNDHTVYTHGFGVATAYGNTMTTKGDPSFWESGIPSTGELGDYEPRVYFGQQSPDYSIVGAPEGTEAWELDYPDDKAANGQVNNTYAGEGGPKISNIWDKLMYAIRFRSTDIFFSDRVTNESQILFDRDPHDRVSKVAPYLTLDTKAVPAVVDMDDNPDTPKELVWIIDGYTTSNNYPYSARETLSDATSDFLNSNGLVSAAEEVNYIRNSVKAVVNAYDGSVTLYQWDQDDPVINAWSKIFPGQVTPLAQMPGDLIAHVRYPEDLFKVQRTLLARYHVTDAKSFYSGGDFWQVPREPTANISGASASGEAVPTSAVPAQPPYYLTLQMPGQDSASFSLTTSYIPGGNTNRNVMTGFLAADSNAGNETGKIADSYGKLRLLEAPRDLTVSGPGQAENTMLADPSVSTALNLLRQGGTQVEEGNLLSLPIGGGLLYVQPIYVQASSGTQYPTLQYVLALFGNQVGFAPTLDEALNQVFGGDSGVDTGDADLAGAKEDPVDGATGGGAAGGGSTADTSSGTTPESPAVTPPSPTADNPSTATSGTAQERLDAALSNAQAALSAADQARASGDWAAYGEAQDKLATAVTQAIAAQKEIDAAAN